MRGEVVFVDSNGENSRHFAVSEKCTRSLSHTAEGVKLHGTLPFTSRRVIKSIRAKAHAHPRFSKLRRGTTKVNINPFLKYAEGFNCTEHTLVHPGE